MVLTLKTDNVKLGCVPLYNLSICEKWKYKYTKDNNKTVVNPIQKTSLFCILILVKNNMYIKTANGKKCVHISSINVISSDIFEILHFWLIHNKFVINTGIVNTNTPSKKSYFLMIKDIMIVINKNIKYSHVK